MKPANELPVVKSPYTKLTEKFTSLNLNDQGEFLELAKEIYLQNLKQAEEDLIAKVELLKNKQEKLK